MTELNATVFSAITAPNGNSPSVEVDNLTSSALYQDVEDLRETLLASLIANGLSNLGLSFSLQGNVTKSQDSGFVVGKPWILHDEDFFLIGTEEDAEWLRLRVHSYVNGYSYNFDGFLVKIALGVLLSYCLIATAFVIYTCIKGISSSAWDSMSELTALAVNSPPATGLNNTCGGITSLCTYKIMTSVVATDHERRPDGASAGHAQLVFRRHGEGFSASRIRFNEKYGAITTKT